MARACDQYSLALGRRAPNFDEIITEDWLPLNSTWVGQVSTEIWEDETGTEHTRDRVHLAHPNTPGCWTDISDVNCEGNTPCNTPLRRIGFGSTRNTYRLRQTGWQTDPFCFDQIRHIRSAKAQFMSIIRRLKKVPDHVWSEEIKLSAVRSSDVIHVVDDRFLSVDVSADMFGANCMELDMGSTTNLPLSQLTIPYLNRTKMPLQREGYHKDEYAPAGLYKVVTDDLTAYNLREGNPGLSDKFRFQDFEKGGELFKIGVTEGVGNFVFATDMEALRYQHVGGGLLQRVLPTQNVGTTQGLRPVHNPTYIGASGALYQISLIWHNKAMILFHSSPKQIHPEMPFVNSGLMGEWGWHNEEVMIFVDQENGTTCTINNPFHNQGYFAARFEGATYMERPEIVATMLHLWEPPHMVDNTTYAYVGEYVAQDWTSANYVCQED